MHPPSLRLYVDNLFTSPYAMSVFVALREKGLAFDTLTLDLDTAQNQTADFAKLSLTQRVPTLEEGDFALSESSAITEYLDEAYPEPALYPADPKQRAREAGAGVAAQRFAADSPGAFDAGGVLRAEDAAVVPCGPSRRAEVDRCGASAAGG